MKSILLLLITLLLTTTLQAVEANIRVKVEHYESIYPSQKVNISVELLSTAFSTSNSQIKFPESKNYIVMAPQSASFVNQEEINGTSWGVTHYDYELYSLKSGLIELAPISVSFSAYMGYGKPKKHFEFKSQAIHIEVKAHSAVKKDAFVLVTQRYKLETKENKEVMEPLELIVGDAVELEIKQKAYGVLDVLLKPIKYTSNDKLRVYVKEPKLSSRFIGEYDARRTDSFTIVANATGNVTLPAQEIYWWNPESKELNVETVPEYKFKIIEDPQIAIDERNKRLKRLAIYFVLFVLFAGLFYWKGYPYVKRYVDRVRSRKSAKVDYGLEESLNPY